VEAPRWGQGQLSMREFTQPLPQQGVRRQFRSFSNSRVVELAYRHFPARGGQLN